MKVFLAVFLPVFVLLSCKEHSNIKSSDRTKTTDTIIKDFPAWFIKDSSFQQTHRKFDSLLKLDPIDTGFDSFQIRIWIGCDPQDTQSLIICEKDKLGWETIFYTYKLTLNDFGYVTELREIRSDNKKPSSGWQKFSDSLMKTGIIDLPDYSKLRDNYGVPMDANGVMVEIGMPNKYRIFGYPALGLNVKVKEGPAKLHEALNLIEKEFNYKRPCY